MLWSRADSDPGVDIVVVSGAALMAQPLGRTGTDELGKSVAKIRYPIVPNPDVEIDVADLNADGHADIIVTGHWQGETGGLPYMAYIVSGKALFADDSFVSLSDFPSNDGVAVLAFRSDEGKKGPLSTAIVPGDIIHTPAADLVLTGTIGDRTAAEESAQSGAYVLSGEFFRNRFTQTLRLTSAEGDLLAGLESQPPGYVATIFGLPVRRKGIDPPSGGSATGYARFKDGAGLADIDGDGRPDLLLAEWLDAPDEAPVYSHWIVPSQKVSLAAETSQSIYLAEECGSGGDLSSC